MTECVQGGAVMDGEFLVKRGNRKTHGNYMTDAKPSSWFEDQPTNSAKRF